MKKTTILLPFFLIGNLVSNLSYSQDCEVKKKEDWEKVTIKVMEQKDQPKEFQLRGESILEIHGPISSVSDLNEKELKELKEFAARWESCIVFIDTKGLWDLPSFPTLASQGLLYYYFGYNKTK